jgi:MYND finger
MACSACRLVCYCSKECQLAHWKEHKKPCKEVRAKQAVVDTLKSVPTTLPVDQIPDTPADPAYPAAAVSSPSAPSVEVSEVDAVPNAAGDYGDIDISEHGDGGYEDCDDGDDDFVNEVDAMDLS